MKWLSWIAAREPNDEELVASFLERRDEEAFRRLYRCHAPAMFSLAFRLVVGGRDEAEEVLQVAWIRAAERLDSFRGESSLRSWLAGFVVNCARERRRDGARQQPIDPFEIEQLVDRTRARERATMARSSATSMRVQLERAIGTLPQGYREVLVLHDIEGYTHLEIGQLLGIESGTSKSQLSRARRAMREALSGVGAMQPGH